MKPYPFQLKGASWLAARDRGLLADEPGLGKTVQAILAADLQCCATILVICPATVRYVWRQEFDKWSLFGHDINLITTTDQKPIVGMVNVVSYDLLARGFHKTSYQHNAFLKKFTEITWDLVIADEAHYMKEQNALRTLAVLGAKGLNGHTKRLWLLTGTPMPNHPGELWTLLCSLGAIDLEYKDFVSRYCIVGKRGFSKGKPLGAKDATSDELNKLMKGVMMRRYKEFVLPELPKLRIDDFPIESVPIKINVFFEDTVGLQKKIEDQEEFVRSIWQQMISSDGLMTTDDMVAALQALGPAVALYRRWLGAIKAVSILPILLEELETKALDKVVIFAHHKQVIRFLETKLKEYNPIVIDGSVSATAREALVGRFQTDKTCRVFIAQNHAAGTGITATAAHEVIMLEPDWTPAVNAQAIMRTHRIGQRHAVRARFVRLADTLDDYISETLARKTRDIARVVGS